MLNGRQFTELRAFVAVAENLSFTRAAEHLGLSVPSTSQAVRALEDRVGVQLFHRTTRKVMPTLAGEQLLADLTPALVRLHGVVTSLAGSSNVPEGRGLTADRLAAFNLFAPVLTQFARRYPELQLRIAIDDSLQRQSSSAGTPRSNGADEAIAIALFENTRLVTVASPEYLDLYAPPDAPMKLREHICIRVRSQWDQRVSRWLFEKDNERLELAVDGPLIVDERKTAACAAVAGLGIARLPLEAVRDDLDRGKLIELLKAWSLPVPGISLLHASDRKPPPPLLALIGLVRELDV